MELGDTSSPIYKFQAGKQSPEEMYTRVHDTLERSEEPLCLSAITRHLGIHCNIWDVKDRLRVMEEADIVIKDANDEWILKEKILSSDGKEAVTSNEDARINRRVDKNRNRKKTEMAEECPCPNAINGCCLHVHHHHHQHVRNTFIQIGTENTICNGPKAYCRCRDKGHE